MTKTILVNFDKDYKDIDLINTYEDILKVKNVVSIDFVKKEKCCSTDFSLMLMVGLALLFIYGMTKLALK